jgi:CheY-like chemotaxis protein
MTKNLCPSCERPNASSAKFCSACGTALLIRCPHCAVVNEAARSTCAACGDTLQAAATRSRQVRAESAARSRRSPAPAARKLGAKAAAPGDLNLVLLDVDDPIPDTDGDAPDKPELVRSDPDPQPASTAVADAKTARRAAVRRAVITQTAVQAATDLLVFDEDDDARAALCELLTGFGFDAVPVRSHAEAARLLRLGPFAAVFLQVTLDGSGTDDAAQLCRLVKLQANAGAPAAALVVIADAARPVDRVRATMAGADDFLVKPLSRGAIARTLEVCGVALPSDSRRI